MNTPIGPATRELLTAIVHELQLLTAKDGGGSWALDRMLTAAEAEWSAADADERD